MRIAALLLALALATPVSAFTAQNGLIVQPEGQASFTVPWRGKAGPADFWCAAGDYAVRKLHLSPTARIYRASEPPRRSGEPIRFTLRADEAARRTGLAVIGARGAGLSVGHAQSLCEIVRTPR
ncbi:MAG: hypothetical protein B7Z02_13705 [Rhodobacterales bacterium 32-67-9]|nr:MAG: hypothetical protein B7Z02_13705 [Rhodobacterales bacterium 32-67-9]